MTHHLKESSHVWKEQRYRFFSPLVFCVNCGAQPHHPNGGSSPCPSISDRTVTPLTSPLSGKAPPVDVPTLAGALMPAAPNPKGQEPQV